jgi:hypothetical protein
MALGDSMKNCNAGKKLVKQWELGSKALDSGELHNQSTIWVKPKECPIDLNGAAECPLQIQVIVSTIALSSSLTLFAALLKAVNRNLPIEPTHPPTVTPALLEVAHTPPVMGQLSEFQLLCFRHHQHPTQSPHQPPVPTHR